MKTEDQILAMLKLLKARLEQEKNGPSYNAGLAAEKYCRHRELSHTIRYLENILGVKEK